MSGQPYLRKFFSDFVAYSLFNVPYNSRGDIRRETLVDSARRRGAIPLETAP